MFLIIILTATASAKNVLPNDNTEYFVPQSEPRKYAQNLSNRNFNFHVTNPNEGFPHETGNRHYENNRREDDDIYRPNNGGTRGNNNRGRHAKTDRDGHNESRNPEEDTNRKHNDNVFKRRDQTSFDNYRRNLSENIPMDSHRRIRNGTNDSVIAFVNRSVNDTRTYHNRLNNTYQNGNNRQTNTNHSTRGVFNTANDYNHNTNVSNWNANNDDTIYFNSEASNNRYDKRPTKTTIDNEVTVNPVNIRDNKDRDNKEDKWVWGEEEGTEKKYVTTIIPETVTLDDRAAFAADKCPTGMAKIMGKCVETD